MAAIRSVMQRLIWASALGALLWSGSGEPAHAQPAHKNYVRVVALCCMDPSEARPAFDAMLRYGPDAALVLGNMIAADADDFDDLNRAYEVLTRVRGLRLLRQNALTMPIWDAEDFSMKGYSDRRNAYKADLRYHFLDYWNEPYTTERFYRTDALYGELRFGQSPYDVQVLMLDTRWHRAPLNKQNWFAAQWQYWWHERGPWPVAATGELLGEQQWQWLAAKLAEPAGLRIIASTVPVLNDADGFDSWALFPAERERLLKLLTPLTNTVIVSGGRGFGEINYAQDAQLWEVVTGSVNQPSPFIPANSYRRGAASTDSRYASIEMTWEAAEPRVILATRDVDGRVISERQLAAEATPAANLAPVTTTPEN